MSRHSLAPTFSYYVFPSLVFFQFKASIINFDYSLVNAGDDIMKFLNRLKLKDANI